MATYTQRELDLIEQAKRNVAKRNGTPAPSKLLKDQDGNPIGLESAVSAAAPKPTIVGDTLYGYGRTPTAEATPESTLPSGFETRKLPGGGTVTALPSVLDSPTNFPVAAPYERPARTTAESVTALQDAWKSFDDATAEKAGRTGLLRNAPGEKIRPLAEFKAESDWDRAENRRAQGELSRELQTRSLRRGNLQALAASARYGRPVDAGRLQEAQDFMSDSNNTLSGESVDDTLEKFRNRRNPYSRVRRARTPLPAASLLPDVGGAE